ncbi:hypothetical protein KR054_001357 [Drosophila jambulina]|nr:hypothetical protein KR054_001357 [Drosophila jambulina]
MIRKKNVQGVTATTYRHGGEQFSQHFASGYTSDMTRAGYTSSYATATPTITTLHGTFTRAVIKTENSDEVQESPLPSSPHPSQAPGTASQRRDGPKRSSEGMKAKAKYKAALKIRTRLENKVALSLEEREQLAWADQKIEEGRVHFAKLANMQSTAGFPNKVEEMFANKRQRSAESASKDAPVNKRQRGPKEADPPPKEREQHRKAETKVRKVSKRHLIVALIDRSDENGQMSEARWKTVNARLVESLFARMNKEPNAPMPTFDGAGWLNGVKILKCMDDQTLKWLTQTVCHLKGLWQGARLEVVDREFIPSMPKAKVHFPIPIQIDQALELLKRQNPDIPTADWKILHLASPLPKEGGQCAVLQINKKAEDILYPRYGKMAWGMGSVYLRLKKRHPGDMDAHTLQAGEVEKDLGLVTTLTVNDLDEEDDDLTYIVNTSDRSDHSTYHALGAAAHFR